MKTTTITLRGTNHLGQVMTPPLIHQRDHTQISLVPNYVLTKRTYYVLINLLISINNVIDMARIPIVNKMLITDHISVMRTRITGIDSTYNTITYV